MKMWSNSESTRRGSKWSPLFKELARRRIEKALEEKGWPQPHWKECGEQDRYLRAELVAPATGRVLAVFIYADEVGFSHDGSWIIAERPDFAGPDEQLDWIVQQLPPGQAELR